MSALTRCVRLMLPFLFLNYAQANCNWLTKSLFSNVGPIFQTVYNAVLPARGCEEPDRYTLRDLLDPRVLESPNFDEIVYQVFDDIENCKDDFFHARLSFEQLKIFTPYIFPKLRVFLIENAQQLVHLNEKERQLFHRNPGAAIWMLYNAKKATDISQEYGKKMKLKGGHLGNIDALRHILWNTFSARFGFEEFAKEWVNAHEYKNQNSANENLINLNFFLTDDEGESNKQVEKTFLRQIYDYWSYKKEEHKEENTKVDSHMDYYNNAIGQTLAQEMYCELDDDEILKKVIEVINNGEAMTIQLDKYKYSLKPSEVKSKLSEENKNFGIRASYRECQDYVRKNKLTYLSLEDGKKIIDTGKDYDYVGCIYHEIKSRELTKKLIDQPNAQFLISILKADKSSSDISFEDSKEFCTFYHGRDITTSDDFDRDYLECRSFMFHKEKTKFLEEVNKIISQ